MHLLSFRSFLLLCVFGVALIQALSIPYADRGALALEDGELLIIGLDTVLERRSPVKTKPKPKPKPNPAPGKPDSVPGKPKPAPGKTPTTKATATATGKIVWPTAKVPYPTTAFDTCDSFAPCGEESGGRVVARGENGPQVFHITLAPTATPVPRSDNIFEKRGHRTYTPKALGGTFSIISQDYPSREELYEAGQTWHVLDFASDDVDDFTVTHKTKKPAKMDRVVTEHIVELQSIMNFMNSEAVKKKTTLYPFFKKWWNEPLDQKAVDGRKSKPSLSGEDRSLNTLNDLVFQALGSFKNRGDFVLCNTEINGYKKDLWAKHNPMAIKVYQDAVKSSFDGSLPSTVYQTALRNTLGVLKYMGNPEVKRRLKNTIDNVEAELENAEALTKQKALGLGPIWRTYINSHVIVVLENGKAWLKERIEEDTEKQIVTAIKAHEAVYTKLKTAEDDAKTNKAHETKQKGEEKRLKAKVKQDKLNLEQHKKDIEASSKVRAGFAADLRVKRTEEPDAKASKAKKDKWKKEMTDLEAKQTKAVSDHKKLKRKSPKFIKAAGITERNILKLYSSNIKQMIDDLKQDQKRVKKFKDAVAAL